MDNAKAMDFEPIEHSEEHRNISITK
jgi:hypothetical protein